MKAVSSSCVVRTEEWWTYEICFGKYARQARYNMEQVVMPDGQVMAKQVSLRTLQLLINQKRNLEQILIVTTYDCKFIISDRNFVDFERFWRQNIFWDFRTLLCMIM